MRTAIPKPSRTSSAARSSATASPSSPITAFPADLIHRAEEKAKAFFALPEEVKRGYHLAGKGGARGYTPFGIETAKGAVHYDLKEFWHVGARAAARAQI